VPTRLEWTANVWKRVDEYVTGTVDIAEFDEEFGTDPATDLIEGMWTGGQERFVNTFNEGAISNMADDAFVELWSHVDMDGIKPLPVGDMPRGVRAMCETILDTHELTAEAIIKKDPALLRRALLTDPLTNSIGDTDALIAELLEAEQEALDPELYEAFKAGQPEPAMA
jgi:alpha-galactosidase